MAKAKKKTTKKKTTGKKRKPNAAFMKKLKVSDSLQAVIGKGDRARTEVVSLLWKYIKKHKLQDSKNRRNINADAKLKAVFNGRGTVNMFEMTKLISKHLK
jgi:chromatin remodeling complex protein RSC6